MDDQEVGETTAREPRPVRRGWELGQGGVCKHRLQSQAAWAQIALLSGWVASGRLLKVSEPLDGRWQKQG